MTRSCFIVVTFTFEIYINFAGCEDIRYSLAKSHHIH